MAIYNLLTYKLKSDNDLKFIFDTNIWLYLYSDIHEDREREIAAYSKLLEEVIENEYEIYISSGIISEFTNVLLRVDYNIIKADYSDDYSFKKNYVGSTQYELKVQEIKKLISEMLSIDNIVKIDDSFSKVNINEVENRFNLIDWNDSYLIELAQQHNCIIVSNDKDFHKVHNNNFTLIRLF